MSVFNFVPQVGLRTNDCYVHGINYDNIGNEGIIEFVGKDYFILRDLSTDKPLVIKGSSYWVIEKDDFY